MRTTHLILHILRGLLTAAIILPQVSPQKRDSIISNWCRKLLAVFNIQMITHGLIPSQDVTSAMFVANHVSWIDIYAINSVRAVRFVAKAEIRRWPVFGWLASQVNTLFTDRQRRQEAGRMVELTADSLRAGDCLCFFPEGATTEGTELKTFKSSLMQAAIIAQSRVWPVAIRYPDENGEPDTALSYTNVNLLNSVRKVLALQAPVVELYFGHPIDAAGQDRRRLSVEARTFIAEQLKLQH
ncbi:MAG TPA: lysophospholipid acyltransferase family protein [Methylophilaceae bacterium]|nr:lysophospholipid acyltransferase family protein [Methylophilaceae bacterium]